jgi:hypothetical protein
VKIIKYGGYMKEIATKKIFDRDYFKAGKAVRIINPNKTFDGLVWNLTDQVLGVAVISDYNANPYELNIHIDRVLSGEFIVKVLE